MKAQDMRDPETSSSADGPSRRKVLGLLGLGGVAATAGIGGWQILDDPRHESGGLPGTIGGESNGAPRGVPSAGTVAGRMLVVIELSGGNDGLATVVPETGRLRDLRPGLLQNDEELVDFVSGTRLHPALAPLRDRGLAVLQGVGAADPTGSHFEMEQRWWAGDSTGDSHLATGFLGRLCDTLASDAAVAGVSLGAGATPALQADQVEPA